MIDILAPRHGRCPGGPDPLGVRPYPVLGMDAYATREWAPMTSRIGKVRATPEEHATLLNGLPRGIKSKCKFNAACWRMEIGIFSSRCSARATRWVTNRGTT